MPDVERDPKLDVLRALGPDLSQLLQLDDELPVGHPELRQNLVDRLGHRLRGVTALGAQLYRGGSQLLGGLGLPRLERPEVQPGRIEEIELAFGIATGFDRI